MDSIDALSSCIFGALPIPPLPQIGLKSSENLDAIVSSHDTIAFAMRSAASQFSAEDNEERMRQQNKLLS